jgi:hypothetical protein
MQKVKMDAARKGKTVKDFLIELAEGRIQELERNGILPKSKEHQQFYLGLSQSPF